MNIQELKQKVKHLESQQKEQLSKLEEFSDVHIMKTGEWMATRKILDMMEDLEKLQNQKNRKQ